MAFEQFRVQLAMLLDEIAKNPSDAHEMHPELFERHRDLPDPAPPAMRG